MAAFLSTNALSTPTMAAAAPRHRCSLVMVRASAAKCNEHTQEPAAIAATDGAHHAGGRRRAMVLLAAAAAVTGSVAMCRSARAAGVITKTGQYVEIKNVMMNQYVQSIDDWAVEEHNRETGESLKFGDVFRGMEQVVAGTNYKLDIATKDPRSSYRAVVFVPLPNSSEPRQLKSFDRILY